MLQRLNHSDRPQPTAQFSEAAILEPGTRLLVTSGQVGVDRDGRLPDTIEEQVEVAWKNVLVLLADAGTSPEHIVAVTTYLINQEHVDAYRKVRDQSIPGVRASSTLVVVSGLADPGYLVEIEVTAVIPTVR